MKACLEMQGWETEGLTRAQHDRTVRLPSWVSSSHPPSSYTHTHIYPQFAVCLCHHVHVSQEQWQRGGGRDINLVKRNCSLITSGPHKPDSLKIFWGPNADSLQVLKRGSEFLCSLLQQLQSAGTRSMYKYSNVDTVFWEILTKTSIETFLQYNPLLYCCLFQPRAGLKSLFGSKFKFMCLKDSQVLEGNSKSTEPP